MKYLLLFVFIGLATSFYSCDKKKDETDVVATTTDSVFAYATVNGEDFTAATSEVDIYYDDKPYLVFVAETGPEQNHKKISFRIDNFPYTPGEYYISDTSNAKALFSKNDSASDVALTGKIVITEMSKSIKGSFYFNTANYTVDSGRFSAQ